MSDKENKKSIKNEVNEDVDKKAENDYVSKESNTNDDLQKYKSEAQENLEGWQRTKADFVNYKKDQEKLFTQFKKFANEDVILSLLPTIDSFNLAMKHMPEEMKSSDWVGGIVCIKNQFDAFLKEVGVEEIPVVGEVFDPNISEAICEEISDEDEGKVIEEVQKGYMLHGKIIRPSKVKVSKGNNE